jgi:hypothetical protein
MEALQHSLTDGTARLLRHWWLILPLYAANLLLGLIQTWPLWTAENTIRNPFLNDLARGGSDPLVDLLLANAAEVGQAAGVWLLIAFPLLLLFALLYNLFAGGALSVLAGTRSFWPGCWRFVWTFLALSVIGFVLNVFAVGIGIFAAWLGGAVAGLIVGGLLALIVGVVSEYARVIAVARDRLNPFAVLWLAIGFCVRHGLGVLLLALLALLLVGGLTAAYGLVSRSVGGLPIAVLVQQVAVLGWIALKLLRLSWALSYVESITPAVRREFASSPFPV